MAIAAQSKPKKRKPRRSFGSVRKLPSGSIQTTYWHDGKQHSRTFPPKTLDIEIDDYLAIVRADIVRGKWIDPDAEPAASNAIFRDYAEEWLAAGVRRGHIRPTTEAKYRGLLDRHLLKTFGDDKLSKIRKTKVQTWYDDLAATHPSTAAGAYRLLATIFNRAVKEDRTPQSPCDIEGGSREPAAKRKIATPEECQAAIDAIPKHYEKYRCAVMLAAWGQLRRGELLALRRGDLDLNAGTVEIERAWLVTETNKTILGKPKTDAGSRTLYLPLHVLTALKVYLDDHVGPDKDAWLFPGGNGQPLHPRTFARVWTNAREAISRPDLHFHDLRRSGLTWIAQKGATNAELMHRGGHSSVASIMIYQHAAAERDKALAVALDLTPAKPKSKARRR